MNTLFFLRSQFGFLLLGFLFMGLSSFGQTYFIALYRADMQADFALSDSGFAALYSAMTLLSSLLLLYTGQFIDRLALWRVVGGVVVALIVACLLMASAQSLLVFALALFMLRHFGQGLSAHTATTAMARSYDSHRGRALATIGFGYAGAESVLPLIATGLLGVFAWQTNWALFALVLVVVLPFVLYLTRFEPAPEADTSPTSDTTSPIASSTRQDVLRDIRFYLAMPLYVSAPFFLTGMFFNNVLLAEERGWSLTTLALAFTVYALCKIILLPVSGYLVDRFSARRVFPFAGLPLMLAFVALLLPADTLGDYALFIYMGLCGTHVILVETASGGVWAELFGTKHLGSIRSMTSMIVILATAAAPIIFAYVIEAFNFYVLAAGGVIYTLCASALAFRLMRAKLIS